MHDPRLDDLAQVLIGHSTRLQGGERILIEAIDAPEEMVVALMRAARRAGGVPVVTLKSSRLQLELLRAGEEDGLRLCGECEAYRMDRVQAYVGLRGSRNVCEMTDVPGPAMRLYEEHWLKPVHFERRVRHTKWVVLRWPSPSMAQQAQLSTEAFEDFYFEVCTLDYGRMARAMEPLVALMQRSDRVRLVGPDTDLRFRIQGIPAIPCVGEMNIPDGECFTAPVRDSVEGTLRINAPTLYRGTVFTDIRLRFAQGRIVEAEANHAAKLNEILDADPGARYVGEFALGVNPRITAPMLDTLFDEKISGSFHLTPGQAYEEADNGNRSAIHWDMVVVQTPDMGGGEIWLDDVLVRRDGRFVLPELEPLNPEQLL
ncbi:MAG: aminopeptidase [Candidatus Latescibacterota bacterium]